MNPVWFFHFYKLWQILLLKVLAYLCTSLVLRVSTVPFPNTLTMGSPVCYLCSIWLYNQIWACYLNHLMPAMIKKVLPRISPFFLRFFIIHIWGHLQLIGACRIAEYKEANFFIIIDRFLTVQFFFPSENSGKGWLSVSPFLTRVIVPL